jgi:hypothetical protein
MNIKVLSEPHFSVYDYTAKVFKGFLTEETMIPDNIKHYLAVVHPSDLWIRHAGIRPIRELVRHFKERGCEGLGAIQVIELRPETNGGEHYGVVVDGTKRVLAAKHTDQFLVAQVYDQRAVADIPYARLTLHGYFERRRRAQEVARKKPGRLFFLS